MKKIKFLILSAWAIVVISAYSVTSATDTEIGDIGWQWHSSLNTPTDLLNSIANWLLAIMVPLAVLGIIYSGILYITGIQGGSGEKKVGMAKKSLMWSIIGIVIAVLSFVIIREVDRALRGQI